MGFIAGGQPFFVADDYIEDPATAAILATSAGDEDVEAREAIAVLDDRIKKLLNIIGKNRMMHPDPDPDSFSGASPANEATDVLITDNLGWDAQDNADYYNIYFGTTSPPPFVERIAAEASPTYALATLDPGTVYYWRIGMVNDDIETLGAVQQFTTQAIPDAITSPVPADEAVDITITDNLEWTAGAGADTFDVYFGEVEADVLAATTSDPEFQGNQAGNTFALATLDPDTTYYWRIDSKNEAGTRTGDVLEFTTLALPAQVSNPSPINAACDQRLDATLSWAAADRATGYNVYIGFNPTPDAGELVSSNQPGTTFDPGPLAVSVVQSAGTVEIVDGVVTHADGPAWSASAVDYNLMIGGECYSIASRDSDTQLTLDDTSLDAPAGTNFALVKVYYWRVDAVNSSGTTTGVIYSFVTAVNAVESVLRLPGEDKLAWLFVTNHLALNGETGAALEFEQDSVWYAPISVEVGDGTTIVATYAVTPELAGGENWRILTAPPLATFAGGSHIAAPQSGTTGDAS